MGKEDTRCSWFYFLISNINIRKKITFIANRPVAFSLSLAGDAPDGGFKVAAEWANFESITAISTPQPMSFAGFASLRITCHLTEILPSKKEGPVFRVITIKREERTKLHNSVENKY